MSTKKKVQFNDKNTYNKYKKQQILNPSIFFHVSSLSQFLFLMRKMTNAHIWAFVLV